MASSHNKLTKSGLGECIEVSLILLGIGITCIWPKPRWQKSYKLTWMDDFDPNVSSYAQVV